MESNKIRQAFLDFFQSKETTPISVGFHMSCG